VFALLGAFRARHRYSVLVFFLLALTGLALCRLAGMVVEDESSYLSFGIGMNPGTYNQMGLATYELPNMIFVWALWLFRPRGELDERGELRQTAVDADRSTSGRRGAGRKVV
jgi:hypothetical protein